MIDEATKSPDSSLHKEPEHVRVEIRYIARDLDELLKKMKREDEV